MQQYDIAGKCINEYIVIHIVFSRNELEEWCPLL